MLHRPFNPFVLALALAALPATSALAADTSIAQLRAQWNAQAAQPGNADRGATFFNKRHGGEWSCASCHGTPPTGPGKHANTGKPLKPLAPAFNPEAFTDAARVEKWLRRNCKDVLSRECSAVEKADVLAYLDSLRPGNATQRSTR